MSRNTILAVVVILLLLVGGWWLTRPKQPTPPAQPTETPTSTSVASPTPTASEGAVMKKEANTVKITASGFSPQNISIKVGETVTWVNETDVDHTVNSAVHPTHLVYPPLNLGNIKPGNQKSLTFPQAGTYRYHDHLNPSLTGSVTVQ